MADKVSGRDTDRKTDRQTDGVSEEAGPQEAERPSGSIAGGAAALSISDVNMELLTGRVCEKAGMIKRKN